jgi:hypothetical protein
MWFTWASVIHLKNKNIFLSFKKLKKKYSDVDNYLSYKYVKNTIQIICILGYTRKEKHVDLRMYSFKTTNFIRFYYFCVVHNIQFFVIKV